MYYTYMLRCTDNSIYTGITTDLEEEWMNILPKEKNVPNILKGIKPKSWKQHGVVKIEN